MSDLAYAVEELREALAAQYAVPLPCSGMAALARDHRVYFARRALEHYFGKCAA